MQGSDNNVITHILIQYKLVLPNSSCWHGRMQENISMQFYRYSEVIVTVNDETICCRMKSYISEHNIIDEFRRYFPDVVNEDTLLI